jgi:hypothetical protein
MIRNGLNIALCCLIFAITHPYAFFSFIAHPLKVTVYWDKTDQDEDIFVSRIRTDSDSDDPVYQEESKRDHDQKSKLKLKIKFEYFSSTPRFLIESLTVKVSGVGVFIPPAKGLITTLFHPPNFLV